MVLLVALHVCGGCWQFLQIMQTLSILFVLSNVDGHLLTKLSSHCCPLLSCFKLLLLLWPVNLYSSFSSFMWWAPPWGASKAELGNQTGSEICTLFFISKYRYLAPVYQYSYSTRKDGEILSYQYFVWVLVSIRRQYFFQIPLWELRTVNVLSQPSFFDFNKECQCS